MNEEVKSYEGLIRKKRCIELTKYYELGNKELDQIYEFLKTKKDGVITGGLENLILSNKGEENIIIACKKISYTIDGIVISNKVFKLIPHYTPSSGGYSGGSSSNNNNNNNN